REGAHSARLRIQLGSQFHDQQRTFEKYFLPRFEHPRQHTLSHPFPQTEAIPGQRRIQRPTHESIATRQQLFEGNGCDRLYSPQKPRSRFADN
ncbi:MAG TPA: hypothetical protein PLN05_17415, partial [Pyrinomonadaceae bacterium]|nr:hypothetical protein [Pyrinomonadaceae bacterium]